MRENLRVFAFMNEEKGKQYISAKTLKEARGYYEYLYGVRLLEDSSIAEVITNNGRFGL